MGGIAKFRYFVEDLEGNLVGGTNDDELAETLREGDDYVVIDSHDPSIKEVKMEDGELVSVEAGEDDEG